MRKLICLLMLMGMLALSSTAFAEIYCVNKWMSKYQASQKRINYLVQAQKRQTTREAYNSFYEKIEQEKAIRDSYWERYKKCEERAKELCAYPKVPTARFPTTRSCINYWVTAGSIE